jgi:peptidylprolyl isomerase
VIKVAAGLAAAFLAAAMLTPAAASAAAAPAWSPTPVAADWRTPDPENVLVIDTNQGRIIAELSPLAAPAHVARIKDLTRRRFYDGLSFFRVIDGFMDQTGDPKNTGEGGSDLPNLQPEFTFRRGPDTPFAALMQVSGAELGFVGVLPAASQTMAMAEMTADGKVRAGALFCGGVLGMARAAAEDSANSQFFLMRGPYDSLNGRYTAFGRVIVGTDVVRRIKTGEPVAAPQDRMLKVQVLADMPAGQRPQVRVIDTAGPYFTALLQQDRLAKGDAASPCDIDIPGEAK